VRLTTTHASQTTLEQNSKQIHQNGGNLLPTQVL